MKTRSTKRQSWWERIDTVSPGMATVLGIAFGAVAALLTYLPSFRDFPDAVGLFVIVLFGIGGYVFSFAINDPIRANRAWYIGARVGLVIIVAFLVFFPNAASLVFRWSSPTGLALVGLVFATSVLAVMIGLGAVDLVTYVASQPWRSVKRGVTADASGVWDRDLDVSP
jgi:hypothetical protein